MLDEHSKFWLQYLSDTPEFLQLPTDRPRDIATKLKRACIPVALSPSLTDQLRMLASAHQASVSHVLLVGWAILLSRLSAQDDLVIGTALVHEHAGKTPATGASTLLPVRIQLRESMTTSQLLGQLKASLAEVRAHLNVPFGQIAERLRNFSGRRLSCGLSVLMLLGRGVNIDALPGLHELIAVPEEVGNDSDADIGVQVDIALSLREEVEGISGVIEYDSGLFDGGTVVRWAGYLQVIFARLCREPEDVLARVQFIDEEECRRVLTVFNRTTFQFDQEQLIHGIISRRAIHAPDTIAVVCGERSLTYQELERRSDRLARHMRGRGVRPEDRVGICLERDVDLIVALLAVLRTGAAYVPLDPSYPASQLGHMLDDGAPKVLITQADLMYLFQTVAVDCVVLDQWWVGNEALDNISSEPAAELPATTELLAYVIYTSGSSGRPKGVMVSHRNVVNLWQALEHAIYSDHPECRRIGVNASIAFDSSVKQLVQLLSGRTLCIVPQPVRMDAFELLRFILANQLHSFDCTPSQLRPLISVGLLNGIGGPDVLLVGGEAIDSTLWTSLTGSNNISFYNVYGPTECTVDATVARIKDRPIPVIGGPIANARIYVLNESLQPRPVGVIGEIYIGGAGVGRGYLQRPDLTAARFIADPFGAGRLYRTGDLGRWRSDGTLEHMGRSDQQIKLRGFRVELGEIETALRQSRYVKEAAVIARQEFSKERTLIGYVIPDLTRLKADRSTRSKGPESVLVDNWRHSFDQTYSTAKAGPSFAGWTSSYTGQAIPEHQMEEWLDCTVSRIRSLRPRRVLEIGCGTGLLLERLAPACEVYRGTDLSHEAIERLLEWKSGRPDMKHVHLEHCSALGVDGVPPGFYDTIILDSVVQYFPNIDYLQALLERAVLWLCKGGQIFVGDVRDLRLLKAFHTSVQLHLATPETTVEQLRGRITWTLSQEKELVIDPRFFVELSPRLLPTGYAQILPKLARYENEMSLFRYDVVLSIDEFQQISEWEAIDWSTQVEAASDLTARITERKGVPAIRIDGIPDARVSRHVLATTLVETGSGATTVAEILQTVSEVRVDGDDPAAFCRLGQRMGYKVNVSYNLSGASGRFNLELVSPSCHGVVFNRCEPPIDIQAIRPLDSLAAYSTDPWAQHLMAELTSQLGEDLKVHLPGHMVPAAIVTINRIPLTPNGKLDQRALPRPYLDNRAGVNYQPPSGVIEESLAEIWQDVLQVERVGREDDFFRLGGNSLLGMRLIMRVGEMLHVHMNAALIYQYPTVRQMANSLGGLLGETLASADTHHVLSTEGVI